MFEHLERLHAEDRKSLDDVWTIEPVYVRAFLLEHQIRMPDVDTPWRPQKILVGRARSA